MSQESIVFLFDVDNTLLDNDRVTAHLARHLEQTFGAAARERYFAIFEELRRELGYADYLGTLQRYRLENPHDVKLLELSSFLVDYPSPPACTRCRSTSSNTSASGARR